jgi:hypothetical protein
MKPHTIIMKSKITVKFMYCSEKIMLLTAINIPFIILTTIPIPTEYNRICVSKLGLNIELSKKLFTIALEYIGNNENILPIIITDKSKINLFIA